MKKSFLSFCLLLILCVSTASAQSWDNPALKNLTNHYAASDFRMGTVTKAELDQIIQAGVRAPSARNSQPWYFTVVQDQFLGGQIIRQFSHGNVLIIVSAKGDGKTNGPVILDCGLAVQSMYLAAQAIGLGSRIYTGPVDDINRHYKTKLGLASDQNAIAVIRIGHISPFADAVSSASPRNNTDKTVTYK